VCHALRPTPGDPVLLADARFVGDPRVYAAGIDAFFTPDPGARGDTFKILDRAGGLCVMMWASRAPAVEIWFYASGPRSICWRPIAS
jgi:hypothetical protein